MLNFMTPHQQFYNSKLKPKYYITETVFFKELSSHIRSKLEPNSSLTRVSAILVTRVRPETLTHDSFITRFLLSVFSFNLLYGDTILSKETTMQNQDLLVDAMSDWQVTKQVGKQIISLHVILMLYFVFKAIQFVQVFGLVVASRHKHMLGIDSFPSK
jgi:hypothetical protein